MKYSFNFCHGSRTVGFSPSTIFVEARPPARLLRRYVRLVAHGESSGSLAVELGLAPSERIERFTVTFWQRGIDLDYCEETED